MENRVPSKITLSSALNNIKENKIAIFRMWLALTLIYLVALGLGFGFFLIVIGMLFGIKRIMVYWAPGHRWFVNTFGFKRLTQPPPNKSIWYQRLISIFHIGISLVYLLIGLFIAKIGIDILVQDGFLGQNLIYSIFFK